MGTKAPTRPAIETGRVTRPRVNNNSRPGRRCSDKITGKAVGNRW